MLVSAGTPVTKTIDLQRGYPVTIDPQDERGVELGAFYVRISGRSSTARFDGYVVPSRAHGFPGAARAGPALRRACWSPTAKAGACHARRSPGPGLLAEEFGLQSFRVDPGAAIIGDIEAREAPLAGARIRLRSGGLPSTVAQTAAEGSYELRLRERPVRGAGAAARGERATRGPAAPVDRRGHPRPLVGHQSRLHLRRHHQHPAGSRRSRAPAAVPWRTCACCWRANREPCPTSAPST